jgi:hypothetical protein
MKEKILWAVFAAALIGILVLSGDGFYRYPCQDPTNWENPDCKPPLCTARKDCPDDLVGDGNA